MSELGMYGGGRWSGEYLWDPPGQGISNSIAIEFDTSHNIDFGDPDDNHISVHTRGLLPNSPDQTPVCTAQRVPVLPVFARVKRDDLLPG